ncbi:MAG: hypothetical protein QNJ61_13940 [Desulfobacterales bacterium]|nr:hypothetical protein [Desulfobacterales bacterium]
MKSLVETIGGLGCPSKLSSCAAAARNTADVLGNDDMVDGERSPNLIKWTGKRFLNIDFYRPLRLEIITEEEK